MILIRGLAFVPTATVGYCIMLNCLLSDVNLQQWARPIVTCYQGHRVGGIDQQRWILKNATTLVITSFIFPPERKGEDRRRQNPLQLQIVITLPTQ